MQHDPHDCRGQIPIEAGKPCIVRELDEAEVGEPIREHLEFAHTINHGCSFGLDDHRAAAACLIACADADRH